MGKTEENLKTAFAGESQANRKYLAFAMKADSEGLNGIAKLFRATAHAETIHALRELRNLGGVGATAENLETAIAGETYEFTEMYATFLEEAKKEGHKDAVRTFAWAKMVEEIHAKFYKSALEAVRKGEDLKLMGVYVCEKCGNIEFGQPPEKCSVCNHPREYFKWID
jgi:rubrerythrin